MFCVKGYEPAAATSDDDEARFSYKCRPRPKRASPQPPPIIKTAEMSYSYWCDPALAYSTSTSYWCDPALARVMAHAAYSTMRYSTSTRELGCRPRHTVLARALCVCIAALRRPPRFGTYTLTSRVFVGAEAESEAHSLCVHLAPFHHSHGQIVCFVTSRRVASRCEVEGGGRGRRRRLVAAVVRSGGAGPCPFPSRRTTPV